jgi:type VI secretion system secreted protein VgrG
LNIVRAQNLNEQRTAMGNLNQAGRMGILKTPLGDDTLVLSGFSGAEGLAELFEFQIDALSEQENINFDQALGQPCTIKLKTYQQKERFFCGILTHAQWIGEDQEYFAYRLVLRPWFWTLAHRANCRIFLDKDVKEIIKKVFEDAGFSSGTDFKLPSGGYDKIDYCVQYRETDFAFVSRLMEQYGIYYFFEHKDGQHKMVLADSRSSHSTIPELPQLRFNTKVTGYSRQEQNVHSWTSDRRFRTGKISLKDYDYLKPPKDLLVNKEGSESYNRSKFEVYDYPGKYDDSGKGEKFAQFRLEAEQAIDHRRIADGDAPSLFAGGLVTIERHPTPAENQEYLVVRAGHRFGTQHYSSTSNQQAVGYSGTYEFQPADRPFRSLPLTPKPRIYGIQTAKVVTKKGEDGEEISTDEHGRIWVKFHWDREPQKTCPIRVAQVWSSKQWGGQFIPRIDMEVVVEFLEGDPDRPLVTGCVYNGDNKYPYDLPDNKTQSGLKSDSSKGHDGYNEFMFEDKAGSEFIRMHAQKDHLVRIENDQKGEIHNDRSWTIEQGDDNLKIQMGSQMVEIFKDQNTKLLTGDQTTSLMAGNQTTTLMAGSQTTTLLAGSQTTTLTAGNQTVTAMISMNHTSMTINLTGMTAINITAPTINLTGIVNVTGLLTVDGMIPMLIPV